MRSFDEKLENNHTTIKNKAHFLFFSSLEQWLESVRKHTVINKIWFTEKIHANNK